MSLNSEVTETDNYDLDPLLELERLGFSPEECDLLDRRGLSAYRSELSEWKSRFPDDSAQLIADYLYEDKQRAVSWREYEVEPEQIASWQAHSFTSPEQAAGFAELGLTADRAAAWRKGIPGVSSAEVAQWLANGFAPDSSPGQISEAADWAARGFSASEAGEWSEHNFSSRAAATWVAVECLDPRRAAAWSQMDFSPELAHRVLFTDNSQLSSGWVPPSEVTARGVSLPELKTPDGDTAAQLIKRWGQYFDLEREADPVSSIWEWIRYGVEDPEQAAGWVKCGCNPESSFEWSSQGCTRPTWAYQWWELGFSALGARDFIEDYLGAPEWESPERFFDPASGQLPRPDWKVSEQTAKV